MNNQLLSKSLYIEGLRKIKVPSIIFAAIIFIIQFIAPLLSAVAFGTDASRDIMGPAEILSSMMVIPCVMTPVLTLVAFFAFNKRSSSDFYHSLPYTRTCLCFSWMLAILTVTAALIIGGGLLGYAVKLMFPGYYIVTVSGLADMMLSFLAATLFAIGCVTIAMSLTGTFISNAACSLLILFLPRLILYLARLLVLSGTPVLNDEHFLNWMNIIYNTYVSGIGYGFFSVYAGSSDGWIGNIGADIFTLIIAVIYIVIAVILFKHRKSETAGQGSVNRFVQHIIRIAMTLAVAILGTYLLVELEEPVLGIIGYCIALIIFFAYEIIVTKKWINLVKVLPSLAVVAALTAAVWVGANITSNVICSEHIEAEQVTSIRLPGLLTTNQSYFQKKCEDAEITDKDIIQLVTEAYNKEIDSLSAGNGYSFIANEDSWSTESVIFNTSSGEVYRDVVCSGNLIDNIADLLGQNQEYMKVFAEIPEPLYDSFTVGFKSSYNTNALINYDSDYDEMYTDLYQTFCNELKTADISSWVRNMTATSNEMYEISISYSADNTSHDNVSLTVSRDLTPETYEKALQLIFNMQDTSELVDFLSNGTEMEDGSYINFNVWIYYTDKDGQIQEVSMYGYKSNPYESEQYEYIKKIVLEGLSVDELPTAGNFIRVECDLEYANDDSSYGLADYVSESVTIVLPLASDWKETA